MSVCLSNVLPTLYFFHVSVTAVTNISSLLSLYPMPIIVSETSSSEVHLERNVSKLIRPSLFLRILSSLLNVSNNIKCCKQSLHYSLCATVTCKSLFATVSGLQSVHYSLCATVSCKSLFATVSVLLSLHFSLCTTVSVQKSLRYSICATVSALQSQRCSLCATVSVH